MAGIKPIYAETLMQNLAKRPALAKAIRRTLSVMMSFAVRIIEGLLRNSPIPPKSSGGKGRPKWAVPSIGVFATCKTALPSLGRSCSLTGIGPSSLCVQASSLGARCR